MLQFAKKLHCAEHDAAPRLGLRIVQADRDTPEACAAQIIELAREQISKVDVLILDELGEAMRRGFVTRVDVEALIATKPATTELVLTGRNAPRQTLLRRRPPSPPRHRILNDPKGTEENGSFCLIARSMIRFPPSPTDH